MIRFKLSLSWNGKKIEGLSKMNTKMQLILITIRNIIIILILNNIHYILPVTLETLNQYFLLYFPIGYFIVKYGLYKDLEQRTENFYFELAIITITNILFQMPIMYIISIIIWLFILKKRQIS